MKWHMSRDLRKVKEKALEIHDERNDRAKALRLKHDFYYTDEGKTCRK